MNVDLDETKITARGKYGKPRGKGDPQVGRPSVALEEALNQQIQILVTKEEKKRTKRVKGLGPKLRKAMHSLGFFDKNYDPEKDQIIISLGLVQYKKLFSSEISEK